MNCKPDPAGSGSRRNNMFANSPISFDHKPYDNHERNRMR
jgi:hypothetical protein